MTITYIRSFISGIAHFYKMKCILDPTKAPPVKQILKAYSKLPTTCNPRLPITKNILKQLLEYVANIYRDPFYQSAIYIVYSLMYKMALRISEICDYSSKFRHAITFDSCHLNSATKTFSVTLKTYKHSEQSTSYLLKCSPSLYFFLSEYLKFRGLRPGPLICHRNGKPFSRKFVQFHLKRDLRCIGYNDKDFNTHSLRAGKATDLAMNGCSETQISVLGRWKTNAFKAYIKPQIIQA